MNVLELAFLSKLLSQNCKYSPYTFSHQSLSYFIAFSFLLKIVFFVLIKTIEFLLLYCFVSILVLKLVLKTSFEVAFKNT